MQVSPEQTQPGTQQVCVCGRELLSLSVTQPSLPPLQAPSVGPSHAQATTQPVQKTTATRKRSHPDSGANTDTKSAAVVSKDKAPLKVDLLLGANYHPELVPFSISLSQPICRQQHCKQCKNCINFVSEST